MCKTTFSRYFQYVLSVWASENTGTKTFAIIEDTVAKTPSVKIEFFCYKDTSFPSWLLKPPVNITRP